MQMQPSQARFGFDSTAADVIDGVDLTGRTAVVTGGSSGIGLETARALALAGAAVVLGVRNRSRGNDAAREIMSSSMARKVDVAELDVSDLASVSRFVREWAGPLDILVNNAGVMAVQELTTTSQGYELQFATNHLGHFALAVGLHRSLAAAQGSRVVSVSSSGHLLSPVVFDDLHFAFREYTPFAAYGQSKTANVLFAVGAATRWADDGIMVNAAHPGGVATRLQRHVGGADYMREAAERFRRAGSALKTVEQGAATSTFLAASPAVTVSGRYFEDCNEATVISRRGEGGVGGVAPYALDDANADRLWDLSLKLIA